MQRDKDQPLFEIEPLEERIAPSTLATGGDATTTTTGGGHNQNFFFVGYDPAPGQNGNVGPFYVNPY